MIHDDDVILNSRHHLVAALPGAPRRGAVFTGTSRDDTIRVMMTPEPQAAASLTAVETARIMVDAATDRKAQDILLLDVRKLSSLADYFVICTASVERQVRAVMEAVEEALDAVNVPPYRREGTPSDGWVLLDYGDVIMHIFSPDQRAFYKLESLWDQAQVVVRVQ